MGFWVGQQVYLKCSWFAEGFFVCGAVAMLAFLFLAATQSLSGFSGCAGIREFVAVLQALPLCGAAPTFLCSGKEK